MTLLLFPDWIFLSKLYGNICKLFSTVTRVNPAAIVALKLFTVSLHNPSGKHLPAIRAVQMDCQWPVQNGGNFHYSHEPTMHCNTMQNQSTFWPTNQNGWCQSNEGHVPYPIDSPNSSRRGLCSSLQLLWCESHQSKLYLSVDVAVTDLSVRMADSAVSVYNAMAADWSAANSYPGHG